MHFLTLYFNSTSFKTFYTAPPTLLPVSQSSILIQHIILLFTITLKPFTFNVQPQSFKLWWHKTKQIFCLEELEYCVLYLTQILTKAYYQKKYQPLVSHLTISFRLKRPRTTTYSHPLLIIFEILPPPGEPNKVPY